jgi:hypothetical protein
MLLPALDEAQQTGRQAQTRASSTRDDVRSWRWHLMISFLGGIWTMRRLCYVASLCCAAGIIGGCSSTGSEAADPAATLTVARAGATHYVVVTPDRLSGADAYTVRHLTRYLEQMTGVPFPVVSARDWAGGHAIFVGISDAMRRRLGEEAPLSQLASQQYVVRTKGTDIFLYGEGRRGSLYAALDFLEGLGWRWYSVFEPPVVPERPDLSLQPFARKGSFAFTHRHIPARYGVDFYVQHGVNQGLDSKLRRRGQPIPPQLVSDLPNECFVHSALRYIPPAPDCKYADSFKWLTKRDYFATNPEFFTMNEAGTRVSTDQLCFSNRDLRDAFTNNVMQHIAVSGDDQYITIDAADHPGKFCHCMPCKKLEETYQSPGGPLYDYLIEVCGIMKQRHPKVLIKTLAYRRSQTQKPPVLPTGGMLPDNLIIDFAPIEDSYFADWSHPAADIQETYADLRAWGEITHHLWAWIYPNPWRTGKYMPVGNVERLVTNFRKMRDAGVTGIFVDHNGYLSRSGFSELQAYLMLQLVRNVDVDTVAVVAEFTDHQYGAAAALMRDYLHDLERGRKAMRTLPPGTTYRSSLYDDRTFPYLTVANIHRWQCLFDKMVERVRDNPARLMNVRLLRRELDMATLWKWFALQKKHPAYYTDAKTVAQRITAVEAEKAAAGQALVRTIGGAALENFMMKIQTGGVEKPLPARFAGIPRSQIRTFALARGKKRLDPDAAFGYATPVDQPAQPFVFGFFQWRSRTPRNVIEGPRVKLRREDVTPDQYALYELGQIKIEVPDSLIHMGRSWQTHLPVGSLLYEPGEKNAYHVYLSLKFSGPAYGGNGDTDEVLCDRIILVKK